MRTLIATVLTAALVLCAAPARAAGPGPSFDCAGAALPADKLICSNDDLAGQDADLARLFAELHDGYDPKRRQSLVDGQRRWLQLRSDACSLDGLAVAAADLEASRRWIADHPDGQGEGDDKPPALAERIFCLQSVYDERADELGQQRELLAAESGGALARGSLDIDAVLDAERPLAAYALDPMSAMHAASGGERVPRTCRELFTLSAGEWDYGGDNIGSNSRNYASSVCLLELLAPQSYKSDAAGGAPHPLDDVTRYSIEFACLEGSCDDNGAAAEIITFAEAEIRGQLRIRPREAAPSAGDQGDAGLPPILGVDHGGFSFGGLDYSFHRLVPGNFTNRGREEALLFLSYAPAQGTRRGHLLLVIYYDPATKSVRPESIDARSRIRLIVEHAD